MSKRKHEASSGMHPSNPYYNNPPDFVALAELYPSLKPYVTVHTSGPKAWGRIDFRDPMALRELTYCLLQKDFSIQLDIPIDSLCPTIPNRVNYICWIEDLMYLDFENLIHGIDIGTGASCIYPLLGCARNKNWRFVATDIDDRSIQFASKNIERNNLENVITIIKNISQQIFASDLFTNVDRKYHFCMCNPPFYEDENEIKESFEAKIELPSAICKGTSNEMMTVGGEVQFVKQMIDESLQLQTRIRWYTSMLGKKSSVDKIIDHFKECNIPNYTLTTFHQGRTTRWGVAWSFGQEHAPTTSTLRTSNKMIKLTPSATVLNFSVEGVTIESAANRLISIFDQLQIDQEPTNTTSAGNESTQKIIKGRAKANTWSRAARRALARKPDSGVKENRENKEIPDIMGFSLRVLPNITNHEPKCSKSEVETGSLPSDGVLIQLTWTFGHDRDIFESFFLHLKNRFLKY